MSWDPGQYERFAAERARPFHDLVARIPTADPRRVVDLGCGPGTVTATLRTRWPGARVHGIDSSAEMIAAAQRLADDRLTFERADLAGWRPGPASVDVIVSNAALQWVPGHADLLLAWAAALTAGGTLAIQVPVSRALAANRVFRAVAGAPRWADRLAAATGGTGPRGVSPVLPATDYLDLLTAAGLRVDAWETTYLHVLAGADPVLEWFAGTGLRPYLDALRDDPAALADFRAEVARGLRAEYPPRPYGTVLPFPRLFLVATR